VGKQRLYVRGGAHRLLGDRDRAIEDDGNECRKDVAGLHGRSSKSLCLRVRQIAGIVSSDFPGQGTPAAFAQSSLGGAEYLLSNQAASLRTISSPAAACMSGEPPAI